MYFLQKHLNIWLYGCFIINIYIKKTRGRASHRFIFHYKNLWWFHFQRLEADIFHWHSFTRTSHSSSDRICRETLFPSLIADLKTTPSTRMETHYPTWVLAAISSPYGARHLWTKMRTPYTTHKRRGNRHKSYLFQQNERNQDLVSMSPFFAVTFACFVPLQSFSCYLCQCYFHCE